MFRHRNELRFKDKIKKKGKKMQRWNPESHFCLMGEQDAKETGRNMQKHGKPSM